MTILARPLSHFPPPETPEWERGSGNNFRTPYGPTERELERELRFLGVTDAVLELDLSEQDFRRDGSLRSDARPSSPRVVLSFTHPTAGPLRYPCDRFTDWRINVRAIRLALQALRAVDRYGITRRAEQYTGWRALPAETEGTLTAQAAAAIITANDPVTADQDSRLATGNIALLLKDRAVAKAASRRALAGAHPDIAGEASLERFKLIGQARTILHAHHGGGVE